MQDKKYKRKILIRKEKFEKFTNKHIKTTDYTITPTKIKKDINNDFDFFIVGSDQVWNPTWRLSNIDLLSFADSNKRIAFSASLGVDQIPDDKKEEVFKELKKFKAISVREDKGKQLVENLTKRNDIETIVDPTMLLKKEQWEEIMEKPKQLQNKKYILNYFLGDTSKKIKNEIKKIAKKNNCEIVDVLNKKDKFFETNPSEFLYLEKNAFLICTDSFHSCIFAILFDIPFIIFDRQNSINSMNSRIETLLNKFELEDRKYNGEISSKYLEHNYKKSYDILEKERKKALRFLDKALTNERKI